MRWMTLTGLCGYLTLAGLLGCQKDATSTSPAESPSAEKKETAAQPAESEKPAEAGSSAEPANPRVEFVVDPQGRFVVELYPDRAPETVKNFLRYVDESYYNGTIFHRIGKDFMIQGGGFIAPGQEKMQGLHDPTKNESPGGMSNKRGTIAMARVGGRPDSATSQFFINVVDNTNLDHPGPPIAMGGDGWGYTVFGRVVDGMDVVDKIRSVEMRPGPAMMPVNPPVVKSAKRISP